MAGLILPDAAWRARDGLAALTSALAAQSGMARFVGGAVRDTLLGLAVSDIDIATRFTPQAVMDRLRAAGIKVVPTGLAHGTVTAVLADGPIEVTTLRRDVATDGRHAVVAFSEDWQEDAARRDFTINALYADPISGAVFDWFGGEADLAAGFVRFIGDPFQRIAEDHLRILRFFRFHARFGTGPADPAGLAACTERANDLMALSRERIADELLKLLVARHAVAALTVMTDYGILAPVLPEVTSAGVQRLAEVARRETLWSVVVDPIRRLAAALPPDPAVAESIGARLKLSKVQRKRLIAATGTADEAPRAMAYRLGVAGAIDRFLLSSANDAPVAAAIAELRGWTPPVLPIGGGALVARGVHAGPDVARLLKTIEAEWVGEDFPGADRIEAIADAVVSRHVP